MKRQIKTIVAVATVALTTSTTLTADACDRGGRRVSIGRGRIGISVSHSPYGRYSPPQPVYSQPTYSQPVYSQPTAPPAPVFSQPAANPGFVSRQQVSAPATRPAVNSPSVGQVQPVTNRPANQPAQPTTSRTTSGNAESSALQLLASITGTGTSKAEGENTPQIPEFSAAASGETAAHVGSWKVTLPGNQSVELVLNDDKSFAWTATKNGKSSSFQGQYRMEADRLTLVRSSDLQQMAGSWTGQDSNFTFKLDGATTAGLNFRRS